MHRALRTLGLTVALVGLSGCYHVTVETGLAPNGQVIK